MKNQYILYVLTIVLLSSCSVIRETHYFKDKIDDTNQTISAQNSVSNYYKVRIKGWAFLSSSRYVSGYFDTQAVNEYFNEISQPKNASLFLKDKSKIDAKEVTDSQTLPSNSSSEILNETKPELTKPTKNQAETDIKSSENVNEEIATKTEVEVDKSKFKETGTELVLILSTNADAVAKEIKNTSTNNDVLKSLTLLANKDKIEKANRLNSEKLSIDNEINRYILKVDSQLSLIKESSSTKHNQAILFQFLKSELKGLGVNRNFDNLDELKKWYYENY